MSDDDFLTSMTLLRQLRSLRNEEAWRTFLARYRPLIAHWCRYRGLGPDDADEVTARVLARLVQAMTHFGYDPRTGRFRSWLKTVVENQVKDFWRGRRRRPGDRGSGRANVQQKLEEIPDPASIEELAGELDEQLRRDAQQAAEIAERVQKRLGQPHTWEAFRLVALEGCRAREVAERLGLSLSAVYQAAYRVGKMLTAEWERGQDLSRPER